MPWLKELALALMLGMAVEVLFRLTVQPQNLLSMVDCSVPSALMRVARFTVVVKGGSLVYCNVMRLIVVPNVDALKLTVVVAAFNGTYCSLPSDCP